MKNISKILILSSILVACGKPLYYYQLIELESDNMEVEEGNIISSNNDVEVIFNFWSNGGSTTFDIKNKTNKTIYIKHDECYLIKNGKITDYYDNAEYSSSSSNTISSSSKRTNIYDDKSVATPVTAIGSILSRESTSGSTKTRSVTTSDRIKLPIPSKSIRRINGYNLQTLKYFDCNVNESPNKKNSNRTNGISFNDKNTPLDIKILITYSFNEDFNDKKTIESSAYVKHYSNWASNEFIISKMYKDCEKDRYYKYKDVFNEYSPFMYYIRYPRPRGSSRF
tara:strand:+ start:1298 stop:2143 length:846 start_codon:yes stop_codon:yes gene_type:complete